MLVYIKNDAIEKIIFCFCLSVCSLILLAQNKKPAAIIFDSDMGRITMMLAQSHYCMHLRILGKRKFWQPWQVQNMMALLLC